MYNRIKTHLIGRIICPQAYEKPTRDGNWGWYWFYTFWYLMIAYVGFAIIIDCAFGIELPWFD